MAFSDPRKFRRWLLEHLLLFGSIVRWIVLSTITGLLVGVSASIFIKILDFSVRIQNHTPYYFILLPFGLLLSAWMIQKFAKEAEGHGTEKVIEAIHQRNGKIAPLVVPVKLVATVLTIMSGGSVGKEGPSAQIGAGVASSLADLLRFSPEDRRKLVICGISGGFAAVFGAPIAGAVFGVEVLFIGNMVYDVLLPSFISGLIAYKTAMWVGIDHIYNPIILTHGFSIMMYLKVITIGILAGIVSSIFIETLRVTEFIAKKIPQQKLKKALLGGIVLLILTLLLGRGYLSLGVDDIYTALAGKHVPLLSPLWKIIFTSVTLSFGGSGGIVTPIFYVGSTFGNITAKLLKMPVAIGAAIGMMSLLSGATNTPIASTIMAIEIFGPSIAPLAAIANVISFLMTGHRSVYPSQILAMKKTESIYIKTGVVLEEAQDFKVHWRKSCVFVRLYLYIMKRFKKGN